MLIIVSLLVCYVLNLNINEVFRICLIIKFYELFKKLKLENIINDDFA